MLRILVVDDDPGVTTLLARGLKYEGYGVDVASSGEEVPHLVKQGRPDLVVLDVMMPGIDGFEVCRRLRAAHDRLPVLMLTAKDSPADEVQGLDHGAEDYVAKPFAFEVLLARIRALLRRGEGGVPTPSSYRDLTIPMPYKCLAPQRGRRARDRHRAGPSADPAPTSAMMDHQTFVSKVAEKLGVTEERLNEAIGAAHTEMLDEAVKAGQITQQQADQMKKHMEQMGSGQGMMGSGSGMMGSGAGHCGTSAGTTPSGSSS